MTPETALWVSLSGHLAWVAGLCWAWVRRRQRAARPSLPPVAKHGSDPSVALAGALRARILPELGGLMQDCPPSMQPRVKRLHRGAQEFLEALEAMSGRGLTLRSHHMGTVMHRVLQGASEVRVELEPLGPESPRVVCDLEHLVRVVSYCLEECAEAVGSSGIVSIVTEATQVGMEIKVLPAPLALSAACTATRHSRPPLVRTGELGIRFNTARAWMEAMGGELRLLGVANDLPVWILTVPMGTAVHAPAPMPRLVRR